MPVGMHVYDEQGNLINTVNSRFPRMMGFFQTVAGVDGQRTVPLPPGFQPVFFARQMSGGTKDHMPYVTFVGNVIKWEYRKFNPPSLQGDPYAPCNIMWGYR